ncbi:MAG TPA: ArsB/NhaD family transporter [Jatrophihabitans sp.]|nr:ArsB/NhaD family transporter [Jatrophihabitans sp.]
MELLSIAVLIAVLAFAVARPRGWPEAAVAVPGAVLVVVVGAVSWSQAWDQTRRLLPVVGFLAAVLVLAYLCDLDGLFVAAGAVVARTCGGSPTRLLVGVFVVASLTTAVLSLDATVVLLTPVVFATVARLGARSQPHVYACTHLANTASLLLPVSNLTNLLALAASGLTFTHFAALMALPWVVAIAAEFAVFRVFFRRDLATPLVPPRDPEPVRVPIFTVIVVALTLAGFVGTSLLGVAPAWAALGGALVLAVRALAQRRTSPVRLVAASSPLFCLFVLALDVVVEAVLTNGLDHKLTSILPSGESLPALLGVAAVAAVLSNIVNNLPAVLAVVPLVAAGGPGPVLAALIGVNIGPNLTYMGSLATLLWRRVARSYDADPALGQFLRLGALTVPPALVLAVVGLWAGLQVSG